MTARATACTVDTFHDLTRERRWIATADAELVGTQLEIARIPAPTGLEHERAAWMADRMSALGLPATIDDAGNVVARAHTASAEAPVVVCAHLDTVFPDGTDLDIRREGNRLLGPGVCDNGRGLAVMLMLARVVQQSSARFSRPVEFVATTGEEGSGDLRGARHYFDNAEKPFAVVAIDGAGDERVINTGLGARRFRVTYHGPGGHSWAAFGVANPVHAAARAAAAFSDIRVASGVHRASLSVCRIGGGHSVNSIAEAAWLEIDARSTQQDVLDQLERDVHTVAATAAAEENRRRAPGSWALTHSIDRIGERPSGKTPADSPLVVAAMEATRLVGRAPELATASTDANAAMHVGAPAIAIGGGGQGGGAHSTREWFDNTAATVGVQRALTIVATMARMPD